MTDAPGPGTVQRLSNLAKLHHVPVFALEHLLERRGSGQELGRLSQSELIQEADATPAITEVDVDALYEGYRYGPRLAFYLYLLPGGLVPPCIGDLQQAVVELADREHPTLMDELAVVDDYEADMLLNQIVLLDVEELNGIREIRFRYSVTHHFLRVDEHPDQALQARYGFLWLDLALGYLAILSRDEPVNSLLTRALSKWLRAVLLPVRFSKELVDQHFSIEKAKSLSYYDPGTGVRRSISGHGLWSKAEQEIHARERQYLRPDSLYEEEVVQGVVTGLGVISSKGKIYLTRALPTSLLRAWARQRLPNLVRDVRNLRGEQPESVSSSLETINRMRLPAVGKAAVIGVVEALLQADRERLSSVQLPQTGLSIHKALRGKYVDPYLHADCGDCGETANLCSHCESPALEFQEQDVTCRDCGATISDKETVALRCMKGHVTRVPLAEAWSLAPNHWFQKRIARILAEMGQVWSAGDDYFHIEGSTLYRLKRGASDTAQLPQLVQNYINNFWDLVTGQIHDGSDYVVVGNDVSQQAARSRLPEGQPESTVQRTAKIYKNLNLRIRGNPSAGYTVEAEVSGGDSVPPQPLALPSEEGLRFRLGKILRQGGTDGDLQVLGRVLFTAIFPLRIRRLWTSTADSLGDGEGLRLTLHIGAPELMFLPWELIFDEEHLGLRSRFPVVRYLDLPNPPRPLAVEPPMRVLVAVSQPKEARPLDVEAELESIHKALGQFPGKIKVDVLEPARREELVAAMRRGYHVFHYIGHATFQDGKGYLIFEDADGRADLVSASLLGQMVADSTLRLVVLNACETAEAGPGSAFGNLAYELVKAGLPAVVAMQLPVEDKTAVAFSREFYSALADGWPVDAAVQEGRRGIVAAQGEGGDQRIDWAVPTLYMRAPDGVILGVRSRQFTVRADGSTGEGPTASYAAEFHGPA
jgi:hypothetical protein